MTDAVAIQLILSATTLATIILNAVLQRRGSKKTDKKVDAATAALSDVSVKVDGQHTAALNEIAALKTEVVRVNQGDDRRATTPSSLGAVTLTDGVVDVVPVRE